MQIETHFYEIQEPRQSSTLCRHGEECHVGEPHAWSEGILAFRHKFGIVDMHWWLCSAASLGDDRIRTAIHGGLKVQCQDTLPGTSSQMSVQGPQVTVVLLSMQL